MKTGLSIICFIIWLYGVKLSYRSKMGFLKFVWGSVGLFIFMMLWLSPALTTPFSQLVAYVAGVIGQMTHLFESYAKLGVIFVPNAKNAAVSLYIDLECSGIIEIMAFSSMLWFFPIYKAKEKVIINIIAFLWIFAANILRVFIICIIVNYYGAGSFYLAHTIIGRMVFYVLSIILYFIVFTKSQIFRQKTGEFHYADNN